MYCVDHPTSVLQLLRPFNFGDRHDLVALFHVPEPVDRHAALSTFTRFVNLLFQVFQGFERTCTDERS